MIYNGLILIEQNIREIIDKNLGRTGLLYRLHSRIKEKSSVNEKIIRKEYKSNGKLLQDIIGLRVMTYFSEDIDILIDYFSSIFEVVDLEHDYPEQTQFNPVRINLVCRMLEDDLKEFNMWKNQYNDTFKYIDSTFEIQIRTTLSEGWHEIDHTLRYKCKNEWASLEDEAYLLNGIHATLETSDRTLFKLFEEISYQHYKNKNWTGMLRNKFRLRFELEPLSPLIIELFNRNKELAKQFYKIDRNDIINNLIKSNVNLNITFNNIIYLINYIYIKNTNILELMPLNIKNNLQVVFLNEIIE